VKPMTCLIASLAVLALSAGCRRTTNVTVTEYGPEYMTYTGSGEEFNHACRMVLHELGYKEDLGENKTRYPYHGEGGTSHKENDRLIASKGYLQTKDKDGVEYKITTLVLGRRDPVVTLESTASDRYKLVNTLNAELQKQGFRVQQY
jgi:hypothetical protein